MSLTFLNAYNFSKEAKNISSQEQINWLYELHKIDPAATLLAVGSTSSSGKVLSHCVLKDDFR